MTFSIAKSAPVIDASVAIKWFVPEIYSTSARLLLDGDQFANNQRLQVPDFFFAEVGNILWKHVRRIELTLEQAQLILNTLVEMPFHINAHIPLLPSALTLAVKTQRTVYDSLYVALAVRENAVVITADTKLYNALQNGPLAAYLHHVEAF